MVTADLLSRAQAGDGEAFRELTERHRRELQVRCYRMLGSTRIAIGNTRVSEPSHVGGSAASER